MSETRSVHVVVTGRVQGVFFRKWTQTRARAHGVGGWVRNRADGAVEAVFCGPADAVEALLSECRAGPPAARVDDLVIGTTEPVLEPGFTIAD